MFVSYVRNYTYVVAEKYRGEKTKIVFQELKYKVDICSES